MRFKTGTDLRVLAEGLRHMARIYIEQCGDHKKGRELFERAKDVDLSAYDYAFFLRRYYGSRS